jgi:hypothetical protein
LKKYRKWKTQEYDRNSYAKQRNGKYRNFIEISVSINYRKNTGNMRFEWMFFSHGFPLKSSTKESFYVFRATSSGGA